MTWQHDNESGRVSVLHAILWSLKLLVTEHMHCQRCHITLPIYLYIYWYYALAAHKLDRQTLAVNTATPHSFPPTWSTPVVISRRPDRDHTSCWSRLTSAYSQVRSSQRHPDPEKRNFGKCRGSRDACFWRGRLHAWRYFWWLRGCVSHLQWRTIGMRGSLLIGHDVQLTDNFIPLGSIGIQ